MSLGLAWSLPSGRYEKGSSGACDGVQDFHNNYRRFHHNGWTLGAPLRGHKIGKPGAVFMRPIKRATGYRFANTPPHDRKRKHRSVESREMNLALKPSGSLPNPSATKHRRRIDRRRRPAGDSSPADGNENAKKKGNSQMDEKKLATFHGNAVTQQRPRRRPPASLRSIR